MAEAGILRDGERLELLDGVIVEMAPICSRHALCVATLSDWFTTRLRKNALVWAQNPVRLSDTSEPEPDIAIVRRRPERYRIAHPEPEDVSLIIEVSDTTLTMDRRIKVPLYAAAGIPEVWIVNLTASQVEVFRTPGSPGYAETRAYEKTSTISPLAFPNARLPLRELFD
jgi:Uma2 family endonuclease